MSVRNIYNPFGGLEKYIEQAKEDFNDSFGVSTKKEIFKYLKELEFKKITKNDDIVFFATKTREIELSLEGKGIKFKFEFFEEDGKLKLIGRPIIRTSSYMLSRLEDMFKKEKIYAEILYLAPPQWLSKATGVHVLKSEAHQIFSDYFELLDPSLKNDFEGARQWA